MKKIFNKSKKIFYFLLVFEVIGVIVLTTIGLRVLSGIRGMTEITVQFSNPITITELKNVIDKQYNGSIIKACKHENQFLIHIDTSSNDFPEKIIQALQVTRSSEKITIQKVDTIGSKGSKRMFLNACLPTILTFVSIIVFVDIWLWRFLRK
ncbi:MAG: hypothetical protein HYZ54_02990 [Ignavibacteriae bacterium]|nr:hypothetical protein [Ignavibacteriota bacterium]